jgi:hypothetical protein
VSLSAARHAEREHTSSACKFSSISARSSLRSFKTLDLVERIERASLSSFSCSVVIRALSSSSSGRSCWSVSIICSPRCRVNNVFTSESGKRDWAVRASNSSDSLFARRASSSFCSCSSSSSMSSSCC